MCCPVYCSFINDSQKSCLKKKGRKKEREGERREREKKKNGKKKDIRKGGREGGRECPGEYVEFVALSFQTP